jgi:hypothetical protein
MNRNAANLEVHATGGALLLKFSIWFDRCGARKTFAR